MKYINLIEDGRNNQRWNVVWNVNFLSLFYQIAFSTKRTFGETFSTKRIFGETYSAKRFRRNVFSTKRIFGETYSAKRFRQNVFSAKRIFGETYSAKNIRPNVFDQTSFDQTTDNRIFVLKMREFVPNNFNSWMI